MRRPRLIHRNALRMGQAFVVSLLILVTSSPAEADTTYLPKGVYCWVNVDTPVTTSILENPNVSGLTVMANWSALEPGNGTYDWSTYDDYIDSASANGKKVIFEPNRGLVGKGLPAWLNATLFLGSDSQQGPVPWDLNYQNEWITFWRDLVQRYDTNPIVAGFGVGGFYSWGYPDWNLCDQTAADRANWIDSGYRVDTVQAFAEDLFETITANTTKPLVLLTSSYTMNNAGVLDLTTTQTYFMDPLFLLYGPTSDTPQLGFMRTVFSPTIADPLQYWNDTPLSQSPQFELLYGYTPHIAGQRSPLNYTLSPLITTCDISLHYGIQYMELDRYQIGLAGFDTYLYDYNRFLGTPGSHIGHTDTAGANEWYVSTAGDTSNDGLAVGTAKRYLGNLLNGSANTLGYAMLTAGDTVNVAAGTYCEAVSIDTDSIALIGADSTTTIIDPGDSSVVSALRVLSADSRTGLLIREVGVRNGYEGIYWAAVTNSRLESVTARLNGHQGLWLDTAASGNTLLNNTCANNTNAGIYLYAAAGNTLAGNVTATNLYGLHLATSDNNRLTGNIVSGNSDCGVRIDGSLNNLLTLNAIDANAGYQLRLEDAAAADTVQRNNLRTSPTNPDSGVYNNATGGGQFDFTGNWWFTTDSATIGNLIHGSGGDSVQYLPYRLGAVDTAANADTIAPAVIAGLAVSNHEGTLTLTWSPVTLNEDGSAFADFSGFRIYRATAPETTDWQPAYATIATEADTELADTAASHGIRYYYCITAFDNHSPWENEGWYSAVVNAVPNRAPLAWAGDDTIIGLTELVLDGSNSGDSDGDNLDTWGWVAIGETVAINNADSAVATCTNLVPGTYVFSLIVYDSWGGFGADTVTVTVVDSALPAIFDTSLVINGDTDYTSSETVSLTVFGDTLAVEMMVANDSVFTGGVWEAFSAGKVWNLGAGDDTKSAWVKFRNALGLESTGSDSDRIVLDTLGPETVTVTILEGDTTTSPNLTLQLAMDGDTTTVLMRISEFPDYAGADWQAWDTDGISYFTVSPGGETKTVYFAARDAAGNISQDTARINYLNAPYPATGLTAMALGNGNLRLTWSPSASTDVDSYQIYCDYQSGTIAYTVPCAAADSGVTGWETGPFPAGETFKFGVRVRNLSGIEESNTNVTATATTKSDTGHLSALIKTPRAGKTVRGYCLHVAAEVFGDTTLGATVNYEYRLVGDTAWTLIPAALQQHPNPDPDEPWFTKWNIDEIANGDCELRAVAWNISETDPNPASITITHGDQNPDIVETPDDTGNQQKMERIYAGAEVECVTGDTGGSYGVEIPAGQVTTSTQLTVTVYNDTGAALLGCPRGRNGFDTGGVVMEATLTSGQTNFSGTITITIPYRDNNTDSVIDGTRVRLELVQVLYYSTADDTWHAVARGNIRINPEERVIYAAVDHLTKFASGRPALGGDLGALAGDTVPDGDVDATDLQLFNGAFGPGGSYNEDADLVGDGASEGRVDAEDVFEFGRNYGTAE